jgi:hypothetical protein
MLARATTERLWHHDLPSPHVGNVYSTGGVTGVLQNSAPKSEAKSLQQLPGGELSSSSSRSLHYLRSITLAGWSKSAADKPSDYLSANQRHMGLNNPAYPCLAAVQALIAFCHRRISRHALTLTGTAFRPARLRASLSRWWAANRITAAFCTSRSVRWKEPRSCLGAVLLLDQMMKLCQNHLAAFAWASALPKGKW